jgi:hypothetical protein
MKVTTAPAGRSGQASRSPGDEIGPYTDTQLRKMDDAFVAAVTVAFATGKESPQVACECDRSGGVARRRASRSRPAASPRCSRMIGSSGIKVGFDAPSQAAPDSATGPRPQPGV